MPEASHVSIVDVEEETIPEHILIREMGGDGDNTPRDSSDEGGDDGTLKRKRFPDIPLEVEQGLCEWFSDHPSFYDMADFSFKNRQRKDRLLSQKASEINISGKFL